jgi:anaerobic dimethyl sulfoxide reductase subunit B (iron-sulfur subunit)
MTYVFSFDATACTGCKACQEACKDKNNLPVGILWRRVIEVTGGEWRKSGEAWESSVFAYNFTLACNHCTHPKCAGVCPTDAYQVRPDGLVLIDNSRCMGCSYCTWACPYGAPQYDAIQGVVTKCDFCADSLDAGLPPSCVAACPLRVLNFNILEDIPPADERLHLWQLFGSEHPFPLPQYSRTEPHLAIKLHQGMKSPLKKTVANTEEVLPTSLNSPAPGKTFRELPLVVFTLLAQMAVGLALCGLLLPQFPLAVLLTIGILLGVGGSISFLHLGRKRNAWRAVVHLRKSWLSREVLMAVIFGIAWLVSVLWAWLMATPFSSWPMAIPGVGLVFCMSQVYLLRAVPVWNNWRTTLAFFLTPILLGVLGVSLAIPLKNWALIAGLSLAAETVMMLTTRPAMRGRGWRLRLILLGVGILGAGLAAIFSQVTAGYLVIVIFLIALVEELLGRWQFYAGRWPFPLNSD